MILQAAVPCLLGALLQAAYSINTAQKEQGDKLSQVQGQLGVIAQQYTDFGGRLTKVESGLESQGKVMGKIDGRLQVIEALRRK